MFPIDRGKWQGSTVSIPLKFYVLHFLILGLINSMVYTTNISSGNRIDCLHLLQPGLYKIGWLLLALSYSPSLELFGVTCTYDSFLKQAPQQEKVLQKMHFENNQKW